MSDDEKIKAAALAGVAASKTASDASDHRGKPAIAQRDRKPDLFYLGEIAKACGYGPMKFIARLKSDRVLTSNRVPYQAYLDLGYFKVIERRPWEDSQGNPHPCFTTMVTVNGRAWLLDRYRRATNCVAHESEI